MNLKMNEGIDLHINKFNKCTAYILSVKVNIDEEVETTILWKESVYYGWDVNYWSGNKNY